MAEVLKEDDEQQKDDEIIIVEDDETKRRPEATGIETEDAADDDDTDAEDEKLAKNDPAEDERDAIRERRRLEKQERKERREKAINRDKLEMDFLRKRNDELERRLSAQEQRVFNLDLGQIDAQIAQARNEVDMAEKVIAKAVAAGNGEDVTQALRYRDDALVRANQLSQYKLQATQRQVQQEPATLDDMTMHYVREFVEENPWYDPQGRDEESAIVLAIDQSLVKDGYDSKSDDYWVELRRRAARRLPERFAAGDDAGSERKSGEQRRPRGGPVVGSGREHAPASTKREIYISPERKQALIDAGVWDDPILRMKYVKRYAEYDKSNRSRA